MTDQVPDAQAALSSQRVPELNGVRGIAILLVLFIHMTVLWPQGAGASVLLNIATIGWVGVELFFVLSGFLITGILVDSETRPRYLRTFFKRRAARILPLFYLVAIISFVVLPMIPHPKAARFATIGSDEIWYWLMLPNVAIASLGQFRHGIMDVTWSVAIEEHFYLLWPFALIAFRRHRMALCVSVIVASFALRTALAFGGIDTNSLYVATPTHLDGLAAGGFVALLVRAPMPEHIKLRLSRLLMIVGGAVFAAAVIAFGTADYYLNPAMITLGLASAAVAFAGFILYVFLERGRDRALNKVLSSSFLTTFGKYSYALYLFNLPLRAAVRDLILTPEMIARFPGGALVGQAVFYLMAGVLSLLMAFLSWHLFEKHFVKWAHRRSDLPLGVTVPKSSTGTP